VNETNRLGRGKQAARGNNTENEQNYAVASTPGHETSKKNGINSPAAKRSPQKIRLKTRQVRPISVNS
jgi:hypothetical protein